MGAAQRDHITDFKQGVDKIDLAGIDAVAGTGNDAFTFIGTTSYSPTPGELRQFSNGGNTIVAGDIDGDGADDFQIQLTGTFTLTAADFVL